jgi:ATP-binding cassette, subfamily B, bacterial AbcA/BmrA
MAFQLAVGEKISSVITIVSMLLTGLAISFYLGWILTLVTLALLPFIAYFWFNNAMTRNRIRKDQEEMFNDSDKRVEETLAAIRSVKQMNAEQFEFDTYTASMNQLKERCL